LHFSTKSNLQRFGVVITEKQISERCWLEKKGKRFKLLASLLKEIVLLVLI